MTARSGFALPAGLALLIASTALSGCLWRGDNAGSPTTSGGSDGPPARAAIDPWSVPDPVPRHEPRSRYGNPASYEVFGKRYYTLKTAQGYREEGIASWYGSKFHGRRTSSGEPYDMYKMTAAHPTLPIPTYVRVHNLDNGRTVIVRVNDRGPFHPGRIIDLSWTAATKLGVLDKGTARVRVESIAPDKPIYTVDAEPPLAPTDLISRVDTAQPAAPATRAPGPPSDRPAPIRPVYLQFGAFGVLDNADALMRRLRAGGIDSARLLSGQADGLFRVVAGPYAGVGMAVSARAQLAARGQQTLLYQPTSAARP